MECLLQYLDDLDDAVFSVLLLGERLRRSFRNIAVLGLSLVVRVAGVLLALSSPPLAIGAAALLTAGFLSRSNSRSIRATAQG